MTSSDNYSNNLNDGIGQLKNNQQRGTRTQSNIKEIWKPLHIFTKISILDVLKILNTPLISNGLLINRFTGYFVWCTKKQLAIFPKSLHHRYLIGS